jgi:hypothetical protein
LIYKEWGLEKPPNPRRRANKTLTCSSDSTQWAWCYGAPCVVDSKDPTKASCNCPVKQSAANTLGGDCKQDACGGLWSAATPQADAGASAIFAAYMKKNNPTVPSPAAGRSLPSDAGAWGALDRRTI